MYNGQRATLAAGTQQAYVADLALIHYNGGAMYDPLVKTSVAEDLSLKMSACVSDDLSHVFVDLHSRATWLDALLPERFGPNIALDAAMVGTIQRPVESTFTADAVCAIPDKMTLLLGGVSELTAGDPRFNADSPDRKAVDQKVQQLGEETAHRHYYLLVKPTILKNHSTNG